MKAYKKNHVCKAYTNVDIRILQRRRDKLSALVLSNVLLSPPDHEDQKLCLDLIKMLDSMIENGYKLLEKL